MAIKKKEIKNKKESEETIFKDYMQRLRAENLTRIWHVPHFPSEEDRLLIDKSGIKCHSHYAIKQLNTIKEREKMLDLLIKLKERKLREDKILLLLLVIVMIIINILFWFSIK